MGLTNSFWGCNITVNMPVERPHFEPRSGQPRSDFAHIALRVNLNLLRGRAERDALIDRVVSFGATDRKVTVLNTPVAFDSTVIDVTPPSPGAPGGDLSHDLVNRSLSPEARASSQLQTAFVLTEFSQPKLPEKKKKLGGLRSVAVKGTLLFTGAGLVVGACTPAQRAILESAFPCAPGPIAGAADGDTAVIENPNQITISGNNFDDKKEAIICLPTGQTVSVEPTPTPKPIPEIKPIGSLIDDVVKKAEENGGKYKNVSTRTVGSSIKNAFKADPEAANTIPDSRSKNTLSQATNDFWALCRTGKFSDGSNPGGDPNENKANGCISTAADLYRAYLVNRNGSFLEAFNNVVNWAEANLPSPEKQQVIRELKSYPL